MLELVCSYRELRVQERWQVLAKGTGRCGEPHTLSTVHAQAGVPVAVPEADGEIVLAKISGFKRAPLYQLRTLLWKAPALTLKAGETGYRLVPGTAGQGLIMNVPDAIAYSGEFALGKDSVCSSSNRRIPRRSGANTPSNSSGCRSTNSPVRSSPMR